MAATVPDSLKIADITRFATRATQIEKAKPSIAYWCYYWIVQQIVTRGLHNESPENMTYTVQLMDKLEVAKTTDDDGIKDEIAAKAIIEQFGLDVFSRADNAVRANKASKQTADTFGAAYTFLELLQIWPPLDPDIAAKIKYAKYHAVRIVKAIKAGEDPNLSNPRPEPEPAGDTPSALDPNDPEVWALQGSANARHASVEEIPDENDRIQSHLAATSTLNQSIHPSRDVSTSRPIGPSTPYDNAENYYQTSKDVSPIESNAAPSSVGGGYFPRVNDEMPSPESQPFTLPNAPGDIPDSPLNISPILPPSVSADPGHSYNPANPAPAGEISHSMISQPPVQSQPQHSQAQPTLPIMTAVVDDQAMVQAQKHSRWAISALNFEDVPTAVKELRLALEQLGARSGW